MELAVAGTRKRKLSSSSSSSAFPLNELNQDLLERVLSFLPTSSFFRATFVCKKWKSMADSPSFTLSCSNIPSREPWFLMVDSDSITEPVVFDSSENNWKKLNPLFSKKQSNPLLSQKQSNPLFSQKQSIDSSFVPVASSGGLICFHNPIGEFLITNPVTGSNRKIPSLEPGANQVPVHAIGMVSSSETFKLVVVSGDLSASNLTFINYDAADDKWEKEVHLTRIRGVDDNRVELEPQSESESESESDSIQYFLTKCGDVVSTDTQRSPCKQFSSLLTVNKSWQEVLYFLSTSGTIVCCNLSEQVFFEYPRLLPVSCEYSIDIVEVDGELCVVLLSEFFESASLRVWKWDEKEQCWSQIAKMPDWMANELYGKKVDVNCSGAGKQQMLVCLNGTGVCRYVVYSLGTDEWVELPEFNGSEGREFVCGYSFEPRIEASICRGDQTVFNQVQ